MAKLFSAYYAENKANNLRIGGFQSLMINEGILPYADRHMSRTDPYEQPREKNGTPIKNCL